MASGTPKDRLLAEKALISAKHALLVVRHAKLSDRRAATTMIEELLTKASDYRESALVPGGVDAYQAAWAAIDELALALRLEGSDTDTLWNKSIVALQIWRDLLLKSTRG